MSSEEAIVPSSMSNFSELLAEQVAAILIAPLEATSVVMRTGMRVFTAGGQPIRVPKLIDFSVLSGASTTGASPTYGAWRGENELIGEDEPDFDELVLLPSSLRSIKIIHRISAELARHSVIDITNAIRDALVRRVALEWDHVAIRGDGSQNTPVGLLHMVGRQTASKAWSVDSIHDTVGLLLAANASPGRWIMHPSNFVNARKFKSETTGQYLLQPDPQEGNAYRLAGYPVLVTTLMPTNRVLLLDPSAVAIGRDLDTSVVIDSSRYLDYDQVALRVVLRMDIGALLPSAIVDLTLTS